MAAFNQVCIIDDDPIYQFGMKVLMREADFSQEIVFYENGQDAIDGLTSLIEGGTDFPPVIFLDLNMPIKDGWEFLDDFITLPEDIQEKTSIYVISSSINPSDEQRAREYTVVSDYLVKPINSKALQKIASDHIK